MKLRGSGRLAMMAASLCGYVKCKVIFIDFYLLRNPLEILTPDIDFGWSKSLYIWCPEFTEIKTTHAWISSTNYFIQYLKILFLIKSSLYYKLKSLKSESLQHIKIFIKHLTHSSVYNKLNNLIINIVLTWHNVPWYQFAYNLFMKRKLFFLIVKLHSSWCDNIKKTRK